MCLLELKVPSRTTIGMQYSSNFSLDGHVYIVAHAPRSTSIDDGD